MVSTALLNLCTAITTVVHTAFPTSLLSTQVLTTVSTRVVTAVKTNQRFKQTLNLIVDWFLLQLLLEYHSRLVE